MEEKQTQDDIHKKMRLLDGNRKAYTGDVEHSIRKHQEAVTALQKENEKLRADILNTSKHSSAKHNIDHHNAVTLKQEQAEALQRKLDLELQKIEEYERQIAETRDIQLFAARKAMGGINVTRENTVLVDKQIKVLENRLDQALVKFNEALAYNKQLREQIDNLRRERVVFDGIYKKLEKELHEKKKQMADIIEKSNMYYEERDMATNELVALKAAAEKDMLQYEEHFRELDVMIEADKNLKESLKISQKHRVGLPKKDAANDSSATTPNLDDSVHSPKGQRKQKGPEDRDDLGEDQKGVNYEEAIRRLQDATGMQDVSALIERFIKAEEQNFSMYNFINDLNNEMERLEDNVTELKAEYEKHRGHGPETSRQRSLKELEEKLAIAEQTAEDFETKTSRAQEAVTVLRNGIEQLFLKSGSTFDEMGEVLGGGHCSESNMMAVLGVIEHKTNEALGIYNFMQARKSKPAFQSHRDEEDDDGTDPSDIRIRFDDGETRIRFLGQGPSVPFGTNNLSALVGQLPTTGDANGPDAVDDVEDERILTQEELRAQSEMRLAAKEESQLKGKDGKKQRGKKKKPGAAF
eukprot:TRINITY_DN94044_c0_g1_i1.p1 TRINITY_DN94044_c0_g1~~TRINITY_DN94044_c0_g1_i1.p1  ORF type:complete len:581 (-),score=183.71 TRINITY_DN94044_c0_g1_i1:6-1748(-)